MPEITGIIEEIFDELWVTDTFVKREFVVKYFQSGNQQYPEYISFQLLGEKNIKVIEPFSIGESVTVHFNWKGKPWTDKTGKRTYYNTLQAWKVLRDNWDNQAGKMPQSKDNWESQKEIKFSSIPEDDDLPF
jgi:hypothetical protein